MGGFKSGIHSTKASNFFSHTVSHTVLAGLGDPCPAALRRRKEGSRARVTQPLPPPVGLGGTLTFSLSAIARSKVGSLCRWAAFAPPQRWRAHGGLPLAPPPSVEHHPPIARVTPPFRSSSRRQHCGILLALLPPSSLHSPPEVNPAQSGKSAQSFPLRLVALLEGVWAVSRQSRFDTISYMIYNIYYES